MFRNSQPLQKLSRLGRSILHQLRDTRSKQLRDEIRFWRSWFSTNGLSWPVDYEERLDPNLEIQSHVAPYIDKIPFGSIKILDVGAGPLTKFGKAHRTKDIHITAIDLLAPHYDIVLKEFRIDP